MDQLSTSITYNNLSTTDTLNLEEDQLRISVRYVENLRSKLHSFLYNSLFQRLNDNSSGLLNGCTYYRDEYYSTSMNLSI